MNPLKGLVAWIEGSGTEHKIMVANLDGSDVSGDEEGREQGYCSTDKY